MTPPSAKTLKEVWDDFEKNVLGKDSDKMFFTSIARLNMKCAFFAGANSVLYILSHSLQGNVLDTEILNAMDKEISEVFEAYRLRHVQ